MKNPISIPKKYNTIALVVVGGLIAIVLIVVFLMQPAWATLQKLGTEIPKEEQARDLTAEDIKSLESAQKFFEENAQSTETVNVAVPIAPEVPSILAMLEDIAKSNGVFLTSFSPQQLGTQTTGSAASGSTSATGNQPTALPGVESIEITANFRGPYNSLINFLYSLERSLRLVDVKTITVTSSGGSLEGNISFKAYYKQVEGGPNPITPSAGTASSGSGAATPAPSGGSN